MQSNLDENVKVVQAIFAKTHAVAASGTDVTVIDTLPADDILVVLNVGSSTGTVTVTCRESDLATGGSSSAITGASFGAITTDGVYIGRIYKKTMTKRYLFLKYVVITDVVGFGAEVLLTNNEYVPITQSGTIVFSV